MLISMLRWFGRNLGSMILALLLALVVWVSAVVTADPNEELQFGPVPVERVGQDPALLLVGEIPGQANLTLVAPRSIWEKLNDDPALVHAWIDLTGLPAGEHRLEVKSRVDISPVRFVAIDPPELRLVLEPLVRREVPIYLSVTGELPLGYKAGEAVLDPLTVTVSGPESLVALVSQVRALMDIGGAIETIHQMVSLDPLDMNGNSVPNLTLLPQLVDVTQPISLLGGFKNVVVRVITKGQVANGYRLTNISVSPPTVTVFSDNPLLIEQMPGFVDTLPVNLANLQDDVEVFVGLNLPSGVALVSEASVLVQVSVAAIEGSITLSLPVEVVGLAPDMQASLSPTTIDVILAGPLNVLESLTPSSFRVILDVTGLPPGVYQRTPTIDLLPELVRVQTTLPETVEVTIIQLPTPTPSTAQPTATVTPTPTP